MLSKAELKEAYEENLKSFMIRNDKNQEKFSLSYLKKARHNLEVAGILNILSRDEEKRKLMGIPASSNYHDWIIISSYYAMYLAATSALAKLGLKCTTHGSTIIGLEYRYCVKKNLLSRKYIEMIEDANFGREDVQKLDGAMKERISVQYTITDKYGDKEAKRTLSDAKEFVNKISEVIDIN
ncbi:MAG: HEPN domain-containing protein [Nanoarchaeota archaeon]|nr:HEPN domain-containing protein [Nanoarchaeota archaeon]